MAHEDSDYLTESSTMMDIEADNYGEISSQYDSCYSSGGSVLPSFDAPRSPSLRTLPLSSRKILIPLRSDNTATLFSEVTNYRFEHGRRLDISHSHASVRIAPTELIVAHSYHAYAEGLYWGPNDDQQNQQLEI